MIVFSGNHGELSKENRESFLEQLQPPIRGAHQKAVSWQFPLLTTKLLLVLGHISCSENDNKIRAD